MRRAGLDLLGRQNVFRYLLCVAVGFLALLSSAIASPSADNVPLGDASINAVDSAPTIVGEALVDLDELRDWADEYFGTAVDEKRSAAALISVVQNGEIAFAQAYGHQDLVKGIPADPAKSQFVVGSITKTFIATAIGQLVDRGEIASLDDPVNEYLSRVQLKGQRGAKITFRMLLNHRAGFEDVDFGFMDRSATVVDVPLTASEILRFMPEISMEPGGNANYSNWSFTVLGLAIEDISGQRVDDYFRDNIWSPLGMNDTAMLYPDRPENFSISYTFRKDGTPYDGDLGLPHPWIGPAGTIASTAIDIAKYMRAHVLAGENGGYPLVSKEMFAILHTETFRNAPISIGFSHAFWTTEINGTQSIEHGGGAPGFQNMMVMLPEKKFGFYVSALQGGLVEWESYTDAEIAAGKDEIKSPPTGFELRESFLERFLEPAGPKEGGEKADPSKLVGTYWSQKRVFSTVESLGQAFNPAAVLTVGLAENGRDLTLGPNTYTDVGGGLFKSASGMNEWIDPYTLDVFNPPYIYFELQPDGTPEYFIAGLGDQVWEPASTLFNPVSMLYLFGLSTIVLLTGMGAFAWPKSGSRGAQVSLLSLVLVACAASFPLAILFGFAEGDSLVAQMARGEKGRFWIMIAAANLAVAIALVMWFGFFRGTSTEEGGSSVIAALRNIHMALVGLGAIGLVTAFWFFNFLGVNLPG